MRAKDDEAKSLVIRATFGVELTRTIDVIGAVDNVDFQTRAVRAGPSVLHSYLDLVTEHLKEAEHQLDLCLRFCEIATEGPEKIAEAKNGAVDQITGLSNDLNR